MHNYAIFELVAVILAVPFSYIMSRVVKYYSLPGYKEEIDSHFHKEWNGKPEDEYYAWLRVRKDYLQHDVPPKYLDHIKMRIASINKRNHLSDFYVDSSGHMNSAGEERYPKGKETGRD